jgi:hypothetical protein
MLVMDLFHAKQIRSPKPGGLSCDKLFSTEETRRNLAMAKIRRLVLDTLKPHEPNIIALAEVLSELEGVSAVNISIYELDRKVENAKITIEGEFISFEKVSLVIEDMGGAIHSIDEVVAGKEIIDDAVTLQG